ncbi:Hypothetical_protein [Hexamita inflata]|uniref:Hypothetical_protein n=1 Tax=Hexamita inflata TaxID=28002 RepID=A0AA86U3L9_9EUKA|nr:Hypothetical protein HINF_LOCUS24407 [Hexamita inflata]
MSQPAFKKYNIPQILSNPSSQRNSLDTYNGLFTNQQTISRAKSVERTSSFRQLVDLIKNQNLLLTENANKVFYYEKCVEVEETNLDIMRVNAQKLLNYLRKKASK